VRGHLEEHIDRLYHFCLRLSRNHHMAEDIAQETLLRAWRRRQDLRNPQAARVWLFTIATNIWRDRLRRGRYEATLSPSDGDIVDRGGQPPERRLAAREELDVVLALVDTLPERQRQVLWLHAIEGLSQAEIAEVLHIERDTVKVNLHHARRAMRRKLAEGTAADGLSADRGLPADRGELP
jgi:RNA polymerase sigma-70 factor (ECF subfamily)